MALFEGVFILYKAFVSTIDGKLIKSFIN